MAKYSVEDIEIIRQKSDLSYEEAVNLLEYHNGSLARSLVDLEKNGRLKKSARHRGGRGFFNTLFRMRVIMTSRGAPIMNLSVLFLIISFCVAPYLVVIGLVLSLLFGYRIHVQRDSDDFERVSFDDIVKNAKSNVQNTVSDFANVFAQDDERKEDKADGKADGAPFEAQKQRETREAQAAQPVQPARQPESQPAPRSEAPASGTRPVNVQFSEGASADVKDDGDGYYEMDVK